MRKCLKCVLILKWTLKSKFLSREVLLGQGWRTYGTHAQNGKRKDFLGTLHSPLSKFFYYFLFFCPTRVSILWIICMCMCVCVCVCIHTHTYLTPYRLYMNYRRYQIILPVKHFTQIGSGRKCWLDMYHLVAGQAVTGPKRDIGQNALKYYFQTGSNISPS